MSRDASRSCVKELVRPVQRRGVEPVEALDLALLRCWLRLRFLRLLDGLVRHGDAALDDLLDDRLEDLRGLVGLGINQLGDLGRRLDRRLRRRRRPRDALFFGTTRFTSGTLLKAPKIAFVFLPWQTTRWRAVIGDAGCSAFAALHKAMIAA